MKQRLSVVYDVTRRCPWNCSICCMGACSGKDALKGELPLEHKLALARELEGLSKELDIRIDFSGGEVLTNDENLEVIQRAAQSIGKENVGLSSSGYRIDDAMAERLSDVISECEMTMDVPPGQDYPLRPKGYAIAAAEAVPHLKRHGIRTGIQTVLARSNCKEPILQAIYRWLCENGVDEWSLLRFYPSGRGAAFPKEFLTNRELGPYVRFIQNLRPEDPFSHRPKVDFHYTIPGHSKFSTECRCVRKSVGILPNGDVTACFWAVDAQTGVVDPKFLLGSLREGTLREILNSSRAAYWTRGVHSCELGA